MAAGELASRVVRPHCRVVAPGRAVGCPLSPPAPHRVGGCSSSCRDLDGQSLSRCTVGGAGWPRRRTGRRQLTARAATAERVRRPPGRCCCSFCRVPPPPPPPPFGVAPLTCWLAADEEEAELEFDFESDGEAAAAGAGKAGAEPEVCTAILPSRDTDRLCTGLTTWAPRPCRLALARWTARRPSGGSSALKKPTAWRPTGRRRGETPAERACASLPA